MNSKRVRGNKEAKKPKQAPRAIAPVDDADRAAAPGIRAKPQQAKK